MRRRSSLMRELLGRRWFAVVGALVLVLLLTLVLSGHALLPFDRLTSLRGTGGSKSALLVDEQMTELLLAHDLRVDVTRVGSREAARGNLDAVDFVFPSGQPAADLALATRAGQNKFAAARRPFTSPLVLATFRPYAEVLRQAGVAFPSATTGSGSGPAMYYDVDMAGLVRLIGEGRSWNSLGIGVFGFQNGNTVLTQTTDVCLSNSGASYLGLVADAVDGGRVPLDVPAARSLAERLAPLVVGQGAPTRAPEELYFAQNGRGAVPMVALYEHQYLAYQLERRRRGAPIDDDRVLLYPTAALETEPTLIALTPQANQLADALEQDPAVRAREAELGFRILDPDSDFVSTPLREELESRQVPVPKEIAGGATRNTRAVLPGVAELEAMLGTIGGC